jgi:thiosulfate/3-mercaptopyruvate sulfurtransferase
MMTVSILSAERLHRSDFAGAEQAVLVDARTNEEYERGHMPGAVLLEWERWCEPAPSSAGSILAQPGYWGVLRHAPDAWYAERLGELGISSRRPIVVYAGGPASRGREGRIAWMLLYLGASSVSLLDGGWPAWLEAGGQVEQTYPSPDHADFAVERRPERRVDLTLLAARYGMEQAPLLVDTRSPAEFHGEIDPYLPRMGRIPSSVLVPFDYLFDRHGRFLDGDRYRAGLPQALLDGRELLAYCEVGVRAGLFALLHEAYTGQIVSVFDGSLMQWALDPALPVVAGTPA